MPLRCAALLTLCAFTGAGTPYTSLYFFGDSLTDTGNVYNGASTLRRYTFGLVPEHPQAPYYRGRFSDGPVWAEHVAQRLNRPQDAAPAGMSLSWFGQTGGDGNNYAVGGAQTGYGGALGLLDFTLPTGIAQQVDFYLGRTGGTADPEALYFIMGGGNDLRSAARNTNPASRMLAGQAAGANLAFSLRDLYLAGARNFVLINAPDVGLIPESIADGVAEAGTEVSTHFNTWLGLYATYLPSVPGLSLEYFDLFGLHHELVSQYGADSIRPCRSNLSECSETLFFDSIHPTARVHAIIGERIADQILGTGAVRLSFDSPAEIQNPEPSTAVLTVSAAAVLLLLHRRKRQR